MWVRATGPVRGRSLPSDSAFSILLLLQLDFGRRGCQLEDFGICSGSEEQMEGLNAGVTESEGCCGDAGLCQVLNHCLLSEWANSDVAAVGTQDGWGDPWKVPEAPVEGPEWKKR